MHTEQCTSSVQVGLETGAGLLNHIRRSQLGRVSDVDDQESAVPGIPETLLHILGDVH